MDTIRHIAENIADELLAGGDPEDPAERLMLVMPSGHEGGGWGRPALIRVIEKELRHQAAKWMA